MVRNVFGLKASNGQITKNTCIYFLQENESVLSLFLETKIKNLFVEPEDKGIGLKGKSYLSYKMHKKATPFLILYVLLKPLSESGNGVIVHRFRECNPSQCDHEVILSLDEGKPWLQIADGNFRVEIKYPNKLKVGENKMKYS